VIPPDTRWFCTKCGRFCLPGEHAGCDYLAGPTHPLTLSAEECIRIAEQESERIKHTSHADGLGMGNQAAEQACLRIANAIRALARRKAETEAEAT